jgi:RNA polymerase sigma-70 factor (ECF subfamily)
LRDFDLAEDVLQDAVVQALKHWPDTGVPDNPRAWLLKTANRRAIDRFHRDANFAGKAGEIQVLAEIEGAAAEDEDMDNAFEDERLSLVFTCCHPALSEPAQVALTLRTLGGLPPGEIARAFLVPETTMGQRLSCAKNKIRAAHIPYRVPPPDIWPERLVLVLAVLYLIFNEGYAATSGRETTRADLCREAIRLARIVVSLVPDETEAAGLLALMLLHDSRRPARTGDSLVSLEE